MKAIIEASTNIEIVKHYLISILYHFISGLAPYVIPNMDILSELSGNVPLVRPIFKLTNYKEMIEGSFLLCEISQKHVYSALFNYLTNQ